MYAAVPHDGVYSAAKDGTVIRVSIARNGLGRLQVIGRCAALFGWRCHGLRQTKTRGNRSDMTEAANPADFDPQRHSRRPGSVSGSAVRVGLVATGWPLSRGPASIFYLPSLGFIGKSAV